MPQVTAIHYKLTGNLKLCLNKVFNGNKLVLESLSCIRCFSTYRLKSQSCNKLAESYTDDRYSPQLLGYSNKNTSNILKYGFVGLGCFLSYYMYCHVSGNKLQILPRIYAAEVVNSPRRQFNFIADVVERSVAALVKVEIKDSMRLDYFSRTHPSMNGGSGFIISEDGLILTNAHVIAGPPRSIIEIELSDGTICPAVIENIDVKHDLALLRIKPKKKLQILKLGSSKEVRSGEWVIAMGCPLTLSNTVTVGVVSSTSRTRSELGIPGPDMEYIQTDAAITHGNSGGPLVNLDGEVVGINTLKMSVGISMAIPSDYARNFIEQSKSGKGKEHHAKQRYLGMSMMSLTKEIINELRYRDYYVPQEIDGGVVVWNIIVGSPAHRAGLIPRDIIVELNGARIKSATEMHKALEKYSVLHLRVFRGSTYIEVTAYPEDI